MRDELGHEIPIVQNPQRSSAPLPADGVLEPGASVHIKGFAEMPPELQQALGKMFAHIARQIQTQGTEAFRAALPAGNAKLSEPAPEDVQ